MNTFTDKCVTGNFAVLSYSRAFLYLHKSTNLGIVPYLTAIQVYKIINFNIFSQFDSLTASNKSSTQTSVHDVLKRAGEKG